MNQKQSIPINYLILHEIPINSHKIAANRVILRLSQHTNSPAILHSVSNAKKCF